MGRPLQVIGLLLILSALCGLLLLGDGAGLVAFANPCVPDGAAASPEGPSSVQITRATPQPKRSPAKEIGGYPVFAPTETLGTPTPSPIAAPTEAPAAKASGAPAAASPQPCPTHHHRLFGEGPIEFSGNGGIDLGTHRSSALSYSQQTNEANLSMALHVGRRTERTSISLDQSFGANNGALNTSQLNLVYSTPQYYLGYGIVSSSNDTQLSTSTFNRGLTLGVPRGRDEVDLILARSQGVNGEGYGVLGLRHNAAYARGLLFSQTVYVARGDQTRARNTTVDFSFGQYKSGATYRAEAAVSNTSGVTGVADGTRLAYALHADFLGSQTSTSVGYFAIPEGYLTLGQTYTSEKNFSFTNRRPFLNRGLLTFDYGDLFTSVSGVVSKTQHETVNLSVPFGSTVTSQTLINVAQGSSGGVDTNERDAGLTLSEQLKTLSLTQTIQGSQQTSNDAGSAVAQAQYAFGLTHPVWRGFLMLQTARTRAFGDGTISSQNQNTLNLIEPLGLKTQLSYTIDSMKINTVSGGLSGSLTNQVTQTYSVTRRFSPVVGAKLTYSVTQQSGALGGAARSFNVDIVGPLAFGAAARYSGRVNPNLPAIVQGHVYLQNEASAYGLVGNRGISNVLVTLDGGVTQRTDATGNFEFRFVRPGVHIVTIATGTLPAGVIPDTATQSFSVQGGQVFNIDFSAGVFAGVSGRVIQQRGDTSIPVGGIQLTVDDHQRGYTASDGTYQIGHLAPGKHTVSIVAESLPSDLSIPGNGKRDVTVSAGNLTTLDWVLTGLGSIEGIVLYTADSGFGDLAGARNVYVVADPGQHAAITDDDGHFLIDNLLPGQYTLSVDKDSLPDGQAVIQGPDGPVTIQGSEAVRGVTFKVGPQAKQVVFTFSGAGGAAVQANFMPEQVPPGGVTELVVTTNAKKVRSVTVAGDAGNVALHYVASRKAWIARIKVPPLQNGDYPMHVSVDGDTSGGTDASITISNAIAPVTAHGVPSHPRAGESVRVVAKIAADVEEGDLVAFEDGQQIKLPKPRGNVYAFAVRVPHALPFRGIIFTKRGERIPFVIQP